MKHSYIAIILLRFEVGGCEFADPVFLYFESETYSEVCSFTDSSVLLPQTCFGFFFIVVTSWVFNIFTILATLVLLTDIQIYF